MEYPAKGFLVPHPHDVSLQTYRGHCVSQTLIRAYFSPAATTAQRYVYAGSADGAVRIWGAPIQITWLTSLLLPLHAADVGPDAGTTRPI